MNKFCKNCDHLSIPPEIKEFYNKYIFPLFFESPMHDDRIFGCTVKYQHIDWSEFINFLLKKNIITRKQLEIFELKWKKDLGQNLKLSS